MNANSNRGTVVGVFHRRDRAETAVSELMRNGFKDVGMVYRDEAGKTVTVKDPGTAAAEGAAVGAGVGALGGALVGLGVWTGMIPIIGPVLAVGALGTVLINAAGGAAVSSIAGALIGWGIEESDAKYYENEVKSGRILVTVRAPGQEAAARDILMRHEGRWQNVSAAPAAVPTAAAVAWSTPAV